MPVIGCQAGMKLAWAWSGPPQWEIYARPQEVASLGQGHWGLCSSQEQWPHNPEITQVVVGQDPLSTLSDEGLSPASLKATREHRQEHVLGSWGETLHVPKPQFFLY